MSGQDIFTHFYFVGTFHPKTSHDKQQEIIFRFARWFSIRTKTCCRIVYGTESSSYKHCHGAICTNVKLEREVKPYEIQQAWFDFSGGCIMPTCSTFIEGRSKSYLLVKHQRGFTGGCRRKGKCRRNGCIHSHVRQDFLKHFID